MDREGKKRIVIHDDFTNFLINTPGAEDPNKLAEAARVELGSGADIISLAVGVGPEMLYYSPTSACEVLGANGKGDAHGGAQMRALTAAGVDPYGVVLEQLRAGECLVLAKLRVNDCHHVVSHPGLIGRFWREHPEWRIGNVESEAGGSPSFEGCACLCPRELGNITTSRRPHLLDYAIPEVREHRLGVVREFMERYDVDGLTLNFLREPFCISFPSKNAGLLSDFVSACRRIVKESLAKRGKTPIVGAMVPWDPDYCALMGLDVESWIREKLIDYVSPSETWVTQFNMRIDPWVGMASGSQCAVYPGIVGFSAFDADFCLPQEYEPEGLGVDRIRARSSKVTRENIRALAHGFYAEGADGVSFFNFYSAFYNHLYPLTDVCLPEQMGGKERRYVYMTQAPLFGEWTFLKVALSPDSPQRQVVPCRLHEDLSGAEAKVRFKARGLAELSGLRVDVNNIEVRERRLSLIPHEGEDFVNGEFPVSRGMLRDGDNQIGFALRDGQANDRRITIQEIELRVRPRRS